MVVLTEKIRLDKPPDGYETVEKDLDAWLDRIEARHDAAHSLDKPLLRPAYGTTVFYCHTGMVPHTITGGESGFELYLDGEEVTDELIDAD